MTAGSRMIVRRRDQRGVVLVVAAVWLTAIIAVSAIAIEVSRLTDTATEVQVAADAAALAAAQNMINGGSTSTATTAGEVIAAQNRTDGRNPQAANVAIEFGSYTPAGGFSNTGACVGNPLPTTCNAVRATVSIPNVRYILASIFRTGGATTVTKRAVSTYVCTGKARPTAPITIGACELAQYTQGQQCSTQGRTLTTTPNTTQNACWLTRPNDSDAEPWFPDVPGCGTGTADILAVGDPLPGRSITNGNMTPLYRDLKDCVQAGVHDFVIPIVPCPIASCNAGTTVGTVVGFATIHIESAGAIEENSGASIRFTQICNNNAPGNGGGSGGALCLGSGNAKLVDDRRGT